MQSALDSYALRASANISAAEVALRGIPNDDPQGVFLPTVLNAIREQRYFLGEIRLGDRIDGYTVYFFETFGTHRELVSVATSAKTANKIRYVLENLLIDLAIQNNCQSLRMHTVRQGLVKESITRGWHVAEIVLRKNINAH